MCALASKGPPPARACPHPLLRVPAAGALEPEPWPLEGRFSWHLRDRFFPQKGLNLGQVGPQGTRVPYVEQASLSAGRHPSSPSAWHSCEIPAVLPCQEKWLMLLLFCFSGKLLPDLRVQRLAKEEDQGGASGWFPSMVEGSAVLGYHNSTSKPPTNASLICPVALNC